MLDKMYSDKTLTIILDGGFGNRLLPLCSAMIIAEQILRVPLLAYWEPTYPCYPIFNGDIRRVPMNVTFDDLFQTVPFTPVTWLKERPKKLSHVVTNPQDPVCITEPGVYQHWAAYNASNSDQHKIGMNLKEYFKMYFKPRFVVNEYWETGLNIRRLHAACFESVPPPLNYDLVVDDSAMFQWRVGFESLIKLSRCGTIVRPKHTTFSYTAWWLGGCQAQLINY